MHAEQLTCELVFEYVRGYIEQQGYPPTMRDIARACQLSPGAVLYNLDKLEAWGWLTRQPHAARSLRILRAKKAGAKV